MNWNLLPSVERFAYWDGLDSVELLLMWSDDLLRIGLESNSGCFRYFFQYQMFRLLRSTFCQNKVLCVITEQTGGLKCHNLLIYIYILINKILSKHIIIIIINKILLKRVFLIDYFFFNRFQYAFLQLNMWVLLCGQEGSGLKGPKNEARRAKPSGFRLAKLAWMR